VSPDGLLVDAVIKRGSFSLGLRLEVSPGELVAVLGPNGSGKSTLLRSIAGLIPVAQGKITLAGHVLDDASTAIFMPAAQRGIGLVFQDGRLFGHMRVIDNVAYAPRARGRSRKESHEIARQWLERVGIEGLAGRKARELSGGQAQRVAVARSLASSPALLMLDEPFAALDVQTRAAMQGELSRHLHEFAGPALLVTHDPLEALVLADRIVVLEAGVVVQEGTPTQITSAPLTPYVAGVVGVNLYRATHGSDAHRMQLVDGGSFVLAEPAPEGASLVALRPSAVTVHRAQPGGLSARNVWAGHIEALQIVGDRVRLVVSGPPRTLVDVTTSAVTELGLTPGTAVWLTAKATDVSAYAAPR
jgi:molybdate transport system ATP-binding protein